MRRLPCQSSGTPAVSAARAIDQAGRAVDAFAGSMTLRNIGRADADGKMFPIISIGDETPLLSEQLGTKPKYWFANQDGAPVLFKEGRPGTGENWAEKVACELCSLLRLPHAHYELATWKNRNGVLTRTFVAEGSRLIFGNEILSRFVRSYAADRFYRQTSHTITAVMAVMRRPNVMLPDGYADAAMHSAADVFTGYLMLDAWIGNTDRHHENWALVLRSDRIVELSPTYDHASSLGREEVDAVRRDRLTTRDKGRTVEAYAARARSAFFRSPVDKRPLSTLEAFLEAAKLQPAAAHVWLDRLAAIEPEHVTAIFRQVPASEMSDTAAEFAQALLKVNRTRLLNARNEI